ncbi:MAG: hypothetical protein LC623_05715 [Halobacteriales archaeon]|nr:hypothetical protein [Halobacteriales archaeon]
MRLVVDVREAEVGPGPERGTVRAHLVVDLKQAERLVADGFRALPADARGAVLADLLMVSDDTLEVARTVLAEQPVVARHCRHDGGLSAEDFCGRGCRSLVAACKGGPCSMDSPGCR